MHALRGTRGKAENAGLPSLQDLAESGPVQSVHGEMMRVGEPSCEASEAAGIFCSKLTTIYNLFDMEERNLSGSLAQLPKSAMTRLKPDDLKREDLRI